MRTLLIYSIVLRYRVSLPCCPHCDDSLSDKDAGFPLHQGGHSIIACHANRLGIQPHHIFHIVRVPSVVGMPSIAVSDCIRNVDMSDATNDPKPDESR